ncbi:hypothetical protein FHP89_10135 [Denitromonas ohlonensis]|uniref:Uncharacterized protein n=2 Tax=Denitromonas TaxID=139331 RepID=A0A557SGD1_9RHOO|nr:hypothetical protein FHP90_06440 [Denitromonas ohlonensis]TVO76453.1 hypothetical protein FHP89_10135 [Denitromonas ohlonensis]
MSPLAEPNTLVVTASRADRNSHGCSHSADWTFFGRAAARALAGSHGGRTGFQSMPASFMVWPSRNWIEFARCDVTSTR